MLGKSLKMDRSGFGLSGPLLNPTQPGLRVSALNEHLTRGGVRCFGWQDSPPRPPRKDRPLDSSNTEDEGTLKASTWPPGAQAAVRGFWV